MSKKRYIVIAFGVVSVLLGSLFVNNVILAQTGGEYDPWLDYNEDGIIDLNDLQALSLIYGTSGEPINKTDLLLDLLAKVEALEARITALEAPSRNLLVTTYTDERVLKLDPDGNVIWNIDIGSETVEARWSPTDGSIYVVSNHNLTKLHSNGTILWNEDISFMIVPGSGGPCTLDVDPNDGSAYVVAVGGVGYPFGVHKYASDGTYLWYRQVDFQAVVVNPTNGSVYLNGYMQGVFKYDPDGNLIWQTLIPGGYQNSYGYRSIAVDPSDGSVVALFRFGGPAVKVDADGSILWQTFTATDKSAVAIDPYRNAVYVVGSGYLHKMALGNGSTVWDRYISPGLCEVTVNPEDGSVYVAGGSDNNLYRVDPNDGSTIWSKNLGLFIFDISFESKFVPWWLSP